jgi:Xaa-Pro dipeptidase
MLDLGGGQAMLAAMRYAPASIGRRHLLGGAAALAALSTVPARLWAQDAIFDGLADMTGDAQPISAAEYATRVEKARALMLAQGIDALLIEPGASMAYFTGVRWNRSERLTAAVLFAKGDPVIVTPFFEGPSVRETLPLPADVRVWQEDEDPIALIAGALKERGLANGTVGVEETVRFFANDGLARHAAGMRIVPGAPVVRGCRMIKSAAEIALMQKAADVTIAAYRFVLPRLRPGMTPGDVAKLMTGATARLGGRPEFALILMGEAAAYPHGSGKPQILREGEVVLMDCGCTVHGYQSDISRTFLIGKVPDAVRDVWNLVRQGQQIAIGAARVGAPATAIDDAVRRLYESKGYGPDYRLPGLSHRTGHGIGMDGHEPINLVRGEQTRLTPGMCFSNEPGLYLPGKFGVRLEDCFHMTESGPMWFSHPPASIDQPI